MNVDDYLVNRNIRYLRISNGYTLEEFAKKFDINPSSLANYEHEDRKVPVILAINVGEYFGIDLTAMYTKNLSIISANELKDCKDIKDILKEVKMSTLISDEDKKVIIPILEMICAKENK